MLDEVGAFDQLRYGDSGPRLHSWAIYVPGDAFAARGQTQQILRIYSAGTVGGGVIESLIDLTHIEVDIGNGSAAHSIWSRGVWKPRQVFCP